MTSTPSSSAAPSFDTSSSPASPPSTAGRSVSVGTLRIRVERLAGLPLVAARCWLVGGARLESIPGLSLLTGRMLSEGTRLRPWDRLATDIEDRGMMLQTYGSSESVGASIDGLAEDWRLALDWLAEVVGQPAFDAERLDWIRRQASAELEGLLDQPDYRTIRAFLERLYPEHPYGRPVQGNAESLAKVDVDLCARFHRQTLHRGGVLVVTGDIDEGEVLAFLEERFAKVEELRGPGEAGTSPEIDVPEVPSPENATHAGQRQELVVGGGADQAHLYMGHTTVPRNHPDRLSLEVAATAMGAGAGTAGRLPTRVREREGLAYSVDIGFSAGSGLDPGRLVAYVGTSPDRVEKAERAVREELERLVEHGLDATEVDEAKAYLVGREPFRRETLRQRSDLLAEAEFYGLPTDRPGWLEARLAELEHQEIEAAIRRWVHPERLLVTVGRPS